MNYPEWSDLLDFTHWFKNNGYPQNPPAAPKIYQTDVSISVCVFQHKNYQVEFYIARPDFESSKHYHNFEQTIIFMGGTGHGRKGLHLDEEPNWIPFRKEHIGVVGSILTPNQWHQIRSYHPGLFFYNCQRWPDTNNLTSAVVEYRGDSLGPLHDRIKVL